MKGIEGTPGYQAPETIQRKGEEQAFDEKVLKTCVCVCVEDHFVQPLHASLRGV